MSFKKFDEYWEENDFSAPVADFKKEIKQAYVSGLMQGFKGRKTDKEISQLHAKWFCRTVEPLLATFMEHGIKHGMDLAEKE